MKIILRKTSIATILIFLNLLVSAQKKSETDAIFLKNGSIIFGILNEQTSDKIKITSNCGNVWAFNSDEILRIKFDTVLKKSEMQIPVKLKQKGFFVNINTGLLIRGNNGYENVTSPSALMNFGYIFNPHFRTFLSSGVERFDQNAGIIPITAGITGYLMTKRISPFLNVQSGYSFPFLQYPQNYYENCGLYGVEKLFGGINFEVSPGIKFQFSNYAEFNISAGWHYQKLIGESQILGRSYTTTYEYNRFALRIGLIFF